MPKPFVRVTMARERTMPVIPTLGGEDDKAFTISGDALKSFGYQYMYSAFMPWLTIP